MEAAGLIAAGALGLVGALLIGLFLFALPATLSLARGRRPGLEDLTLEEAAAGCGSRVRRRGTSSKRPASWWGNVSPTAAATDLIRTRRPSGGAMVTASRVPSPSPGYWDSLGSTRGPCIVSTTDFSIAKHPPDMPGYGYATVGKRGR
jgi:hypothetical protein